MVELKKGDWDNLQGSVLIYSRYADPDNFFRSSFTCPDCGESQHFHHGQLSTLYCDTDPVRFADHIGAPVGMLEEIVREPNQKMPPEFCNEEEPGRKVMSFFGAPLAFDHEADILIRDWDVLFMGTYGDVRNCASILPLGSQLYFPRFEEQFYRRHRMQPQHHQHASHQTATYKAFTSDELARHLFTNIIGRSLDVRHLSSGERDTYFSRLKANLLHFCDGAPFVQDVLTLTALLEQGCDNQELLQAYVFKIAAVHGERYEDADKYLRAILRLSPHS